MRLPFVEYAVYTTAVQHLVALYLCYLQPFLCNMFLESLAHMRTLTEIHTRGDIIRVRQLQAAMYAIMR